MINGQNLINDGLTSSCANNGQTTITSGNIVQLSSYTDVAALNFSSTAMRSAMIRSMESWVFRANVDGFRCDFADNPPIDFWKQAIDTAAPDPQQDIYDSEMKSGDELALQAIGQVTWVDAQGRTRSCTTSSCPVATWPFPGETCRPGWPRSAPWVR